MSKGDLLKSIERVSYSATWEDKRHKYFSKDIYLDSEAYYEIDYIALSCL